MGLRTFCWRRPSYAPGKLLLLVGILGICTIALLTQFLLSTPWLGLTFRGDLETGLVVVSEVAPSGPAAGQVEPGDRIQGIRFGNGTYLPLRSALVLPEGAYGLPDRDQFQSFFTDEAELYRGLTAGTVTLELLAGETVALKPSMRPVASVPLPYWIAMLCGLSALLVGVGVWAYRRQSEACRHFAINGAGMFVAACAATPINHRELTLRPQLLESLTHANLFGVTIACFAFVALIWSYPVQLGRAPVAKMLYLAAAMITAVSVLELSPSPLLLFQLPIVLSMLVLFPLFGALQWRRTSAEPADRSALLWLLMVVLITIGTAIVANLMQVALAREVYLSTSGVYALVFCMYVALAFGVVRYRLFNLGQWWFEAMIWALSGMTVLALDALLLTLNAGAGASLGASLLIAGWLYFPLRQYLWRKVNPAAGQAIERHLPELIQTLFSARSAEGLRVSWQRLLTRVFEPLSVRMLDEKCQRATLDREGLVLLSPTIDGRGCLELSHGHKGKRLFTSEDLRLAEALLALTQQAEALQRAEDGRTRELAAREEEKAGLLRDLHDGIGSLATTIAMVADMTLKKSGEPVVREHLESIANLARETLGEVRAIMQALDDDIDWVTLGAQFRVLGRSLAEAGGLDFEMTVALDEETPVPDSVILLNVSRVYKECLTNALKHARASRIRVSLHVAPPGLRLVVVDDGVGMPSSAAAIRVDGTGRGSGNLATRARHLGARLEISSEAGKGTRVEFSLPLAGNDIGTGIARIGEAAGDALAVMPGLPGSNGRGAAA
ncbi:Signal transduction histidine kinase [Marinobacter daqiaonensis]|uniref:histidine kinase n=1 Tax=Marinobacter daqiaonensis TaxID=650891 RepID=A0A1I6I5C1_9GAMM|nr:ATP-binding protein [Marinobacter daqiaonensis]SFR61869.1 Signal transduction histidine kinase [Marinobacter daqiaonensis]